MSAAKAWWQQYGLTALLGAAAATGLAAVGIETDWGRNVRAVATPQSTGGGASELTPTIPAFKLGELDLAFKDSGERPLFTPSRRPPVPVQAAATPQMKRGQFKLAGTVVNAEVSVAYLVEIAGNKTHRVSKGAQVLGQAGLTLDSVDASRVVLKMGDETEILELRTASSPPPSALPPPSAVAANQPMPGQPAISGQNPAAGASPSPVAPFMPSRPAVAQNQPGQQGYSGPPPVTFLGGRPRTGMEDAAGEAIEARIRAQQLEAQQDQAGAAQRRRRFQNPPQTAPTPPK